MDFGWTVKKLFGLGKDVYDKGPISSIMWHPSFGTTSSLWKCNFYVFFYNFVLSCILDMVLKLAGYNVSLLKIQRRIISGMVALKFFTTNRFTLETKNYNSLNGFLTNEDK